EREEAAEQRVAELARANAALRRSLERLAGQPAEFFSHLLLETLRHAGAEAVTAVVRSQEPDEWMVVCHSRDGRTTEAAFAAAVPLRDSAFVGQMASLRDPLHVQLDGSAPLPDWPEFIGFHRQAG